MIGLISNRASGHNRDQFEVLAKRIEQEANITHVITHSPQDIAAAVDALRSQGIDKLAINGGDGTVSAILGHLLENKVFEPLPPVVVLPGGTANMNAGDIGIAGNLRKAVEKLCLWSRTEGRSVNTIERVLMRVELDPSAIHYGMFLGAGAVMQGTEYAHREIHSRGLRDDLSVGLGALRTVWGVVRQEPDFVRFLPVEIDIPGTGYRRQHDALILAISSLDHLFLGMRPFWGTEKGALRLSVIESGCQHFLRTFISIARGKPNRHARPELGYTSMNTDFVALHMSGSLNLDGEILISSIDQGPVKISASKSVSFIRL